MRLDGLSVELKQALQGALNTSTTQEGTAAGGELEVVAKRA